MPIPHKGKWGEEPKGRMKPCLGCGTEFYCVPSRDVGGTLPEAKYCRLRCFHAHRFYVPFDADKFFAKSVWTVDGCLIWLGNTYNAGYGTVSYHADPHAERKMVATHRVAWMLKKGPIPDGMDVLHRCDRRLCMNIEHLFLGTHAENMADMIRKGRGAHQQLNSCR